MDDFYGEDGTTVSEIDTRPEVNESELAQWEGRWF